MPRIRKVVISPKAIRERLSATRFAAERIARQGKIGSLVQRGFDTSAVRGLLSSRIYTAEIHPRTLEGLQDFVVRWVNRRAEESIRIHEKAKQLAAKEGIPEIRAYTNLVAEKKNVIGKQLEEKAALEQLLWALNHQRLARKRGQRIDHVAPSGIVREFGGSFFDGRDHPNSVVRLVNGVMGIPLTHAPLPVAKAYYGLPTASETIAMGRIPVFFYSGKPSWGCGMQCNVINAVLNAWGMENYHIRTINNAGHPHSIVLAKPERSRKLWLLADPFMQGKTFIGLLGIREGFGGNPAVVQVGQRMRERIRALEGEGHWSRGRSLRDHITNFVEYEEEH